MAGSVSSIPGEADIDIPRTVSTEAHHTRVGVALNPSCLLLHDEYARSIASKPLRGRFPNWSRRPARSHCEAIVRAEAQAGRARAGPARPSGRADAPTTKGPAPSEPGHRSDGGVRALAGWAPDDVDRDHLGKSQLEC